MAGSNQSAYRRKSDDSKVEGGGKQKSVVPAYRNDQEDHGGKKANKESKFRAGSNA